MSGMAGPKWMAVLVFVAMLATGMYVAAMSRQTVEAGPVLQGGPPGHAQQIEDAIRDAEDALCGRQTPPR